MTTKVDTPAPALPHAPRAQWNNTVFGGVHLEGPYLPGGQSGKADFPLVLGKGTFFNRDGLDSARDFTRAADIATDIAQDTNSLAGIFQSRDGSWQVGRLAVSTANGAQEYINRRDLSNTDGSLKLTRDNSALKAVAHGSHTIQMFEDASDKVGKFEDWYHSDNDGGWA